VIRILKILLVLSIAGFGIAGFMSNMVDYTATREQVKQVLEMAPGTPGIEWRSIHTEIAIDIGFALIYMTKLVMAFLCLICSFQMIKNINSDTETFQAAKHLGIVACAVGVIMFFIGFIVFTETYFEYWRVPILGVATHDFAFSYITMLSLFFIILAQKDYLK